MGCSRGQNWWGRTWERGDPSVINNTASSRHRMEDWADTAPAWQLPFAPPSPVYLHPLPSFLLLSLLITSSLSIFPPSTSCEIYKQWWCWGGCPYSRGCQFPWGTVLGSWRFPQLLHPSHLPVSPGQERPPVWEHRGSFPKEDPYPLAGLLSLSSYSISSKGKLQAPCAVTSQKRVRSGICSPPPRRVSLLLPAAASPSLMFRSLYGPYNAPFSSSSSFFSGFCCFFPFSFPS